MLLYERIGDLAVFAERAGRDNFVEAHQAWVTGHVSCDYGGEPGSDASGLILCHAD